MYRPRTIYDRPSAAAAKYLMSANLLRMCVAALESFSRYVGQLQL